MNSPADGVSQVRLALLGLPGAGKSTFVTIAAGWAAEHGYAVRKIVLASPLYEAQAAIYEICGVPLEDGVQDGELLNFLGAHLRKINPAVLRDRFEARISLLAKETRTLVLCPDARPLDVGYLRRAGFRTVLVSVSPEESQKRRIARGDLSLGATDHSTETGLDPGQVDITLGNHGSPAEYAESVRALLNAVAP
ncbi:hypothetical protein FPZ12_041240 [Amycolatopsis acidicola]|uniref:AAA family ATPase n=1 Tax=Amycolatopsis acidicola TaxID=2596893 RepID=A0A5N0UMU3_9PSEU|nr:hypothetical protein [Amycolatopsis acidicola]KAA9150340.1 hypothetical protein FPZ12_041240 [Amycolatopsis acidicola]